MSWDHRPVYRLVCPAKDLREREDADIMFRIEMKKWWGQWQFVNYVHGTERATLAAWEHANPEPDHVVILGPLKGEAKP